MHRHSATAASVRLKVGVHVYTVLHPGRDGAVVRCSVVIVILSSSLCIMK